MPEGHTIHRAARPAAATARAATSWRPRRPRAASPTPPPASTAPARPRSRRGASTCSTSEPAARSSTSTWACSAVRRARPASRRRRPPGAVRLRLDADTAAPSTCSGPTACRWATSPTGRRILARLGPDPLRRDAGRRRRFVDPGTGQPGPDGPLLMDQAVVAGVGNVYRAEALFLEGIHPERPGRSLSARAGRPRHCGRCCVALLGDGLRRGRIVTIDPRSSNAHSGRPPRRGARRTTWAAAADVGVPPPHLPPLSAARCAAGSWPAAGATPARAANPRRLTG